MIKADETTTAAAGEESTSAAKDTEAVKTDAIGEEAPKSEEEDEETESEQEDSDDNEESAAPDVPCDDEDDDMESLEAEDFIEPQTPLQLPPIRVHLKNFLTDFTPTLEEFRGIQRKTNKGYDTLVHGLQAIRRRAIELINRIKWRNWMKISKQKDISAHEKNVYIKTINNAVREFQEGIERLIDEKLDEARLTNAIFDNGNLVKNITTSLEKEMLEQRRAARALINLVDGLNHGINLRYEHLENAVHEIKHGLNTHQ